MGQKERTITIECPQRDVKEVQVSIRHFVNRFLCVKEITSIIQSIKNKLYKVY